MKNDQKPKDCPEFRDLIWALSEVINMWIAGLIFWLAWFKAFP